MAMRLATFADGWLPGMSRTSTLAGSSASPLSWTPDISMDGVTRGAPVRWGGRVCQRFWKSCANYSGLRISRSASSRVFDVAPRRTLYEYVAHVRWPSLSVRALFSKQNE